MPFLEEILTFTIFRIFLGDSQFTHPSVSCGPESQVLFPALNIMPHTIPSHIIFLNIVLSPIWSVSKKKFALPSILYHLSSTLYYLIFCCIKILILSPPLPNVSFPPAILQTVYLSAQVSTSARTSVRSSIRCQRPVRDAQR